MSKQESLREGLSTVILMNVEANSLGDIVFKVDGLDNVFSYLHSRDVVLKVNTAKPPIVFKEKFAIDSKLLAMIIEKVRDTYDRAGYGFEPLIGEKK